MLVTRISITESVYQHLGKGGGTERMCEKRRLQLGVSLEIHICTIENTLVSLALEERKCCKVFYTEKNLD
jgi:hypothetical protein